MFAMTDHGKVPDALRAAVIDTNSIGGGYLDVRALENLAEVMRKKAPGAEIWIPEPVMWEWAAHAQQVYDDGVASNNTTVKRLSQSGVTVGLQHIKESDKVNVEDEIVGRIEALPSPFRILRLADHPAIAIGALRDQITLRPPAKRKNGVKTGAADIAAIRLAEANADAEGIHYEYAIVSADGDVSKMLEWENHPVHGFRDLHALRQALLDFVPVELRVLPNLYARVLQRIDAVRAGTSFLPDPRDNGVIGDLVGTDDPLSLAVDVERLRQIVLIRNIEVDQIARVGSVVVLALGDVTATAWRMDNFGNELVSEVEAAYRELLTMSATFSLDDDSSPVEIEDCSVSPSVDRYSDEDEALLGVVELLAIVPGFADLLDDDGIPLLSQVGDEWTAEINGKVVEISVSGPFRSDDDWEWSLVVTVGDRSASVECYFQDTWVGGSEGTYMEPPYVVSGDDNLGEFSLSVFLLAEVHGAKDTYLADEVH